MAKGPLERLLDRQTWLDGLADRIQPITEKLYPGEIGRVIKDALNGVWLGHSLHSAISDVPIGAWATAEMLDLVSAQRGGDDGLDRAADLAVGMGVIGAVGAAATGVTDWSQIGGAPRRMGLAHALVNVVGLTLNLASLVVRMRGGSRGIARALSAGGFVVNVAAAYVGGELVYRLGQAVNRDAWVEGPEQFTDVAAAVDLIPGKMKMVEVANTAVVLLKDGDGMHAFGGICPHIGGPLWEGELDGHCVTCPWHGSQFDVRDGKLLHGPSTHPVPCFEVREREGRIQVRLEQG
ncbi:MAG: Rieske 2Fe-2S domain-containing protein [Chloroflexota bacterium]|nr:Rieske 2Fe-2S domain-containing protein [Chloroflexota bacterium]